MNNMKEVKIIQSKTEPNKNHLWLSDEGLKQFKGDGWEQVLSNDGGGSGGGSTDPNDENYVEYLDISQGTNIMVIEAGAISPMMIKFKLLQQTSFGNIGDIVIMSAGMFFLLGGTEIAQEGLIQCSIFPNQKSYINKTLMTTKELLKNNGYGIDYDSIPRITKEQFYNLNE